MVTTRSQSQVTESSSLPVRSKALTTQGHRLGKRPGSDCHDESRDRKRARSATDEDWTGLAFLAFQLTRETTEEASGALPTAPLSTLNQPTPADDLVENPAQLRATSHDVEVYNETSPLETVANAEDETQSFGAIPFPAVVVQGAANEITPDSSQKTPDLTSTFENDAAPGRLYDTAMTSIQDEQLPAILLPQATETPMNHVPIVVGQEAADLHIREDSAMNWNEAIEGERYSALHSAKEPSGSIDISLMTKPSKHTPTHIHRSLMKPTNSSRSTSSLSRYRHSILERHKRTPFWGKKKVKFVEMDVR